MTTELDDIIASADYWLNRTHDEPYPTAAIDLVKRLALEVERLRELIIQNMEPKES